MNNIPPPKKPALVPIGILLMLLSAFVARQLSQAADSMPPGTLRTVSFFATDFFRLCFFAGLGCAIIGVRRNRKLKQQSSKSET